MTSPWSGLQLDSLKLVFEDASVGFCLLDTELRYRHINPWLAKVHGRSPDAHLGKTVREVMFKAADVVERPLRRVLNTGQSLVGAVVEIETPALSGQLRSFSRDFAAVVDESGAIAGVSCIIREVTEDSQPRAAVGPLAKGMAQDFNNILAVIGLSGHLLKRDPDLDAKSKEQVDAILHQANLAKTLIQQILDFGSAASLRRLPTDLVQLIKSVVQLLGRAEGIEVSIDMSFGLATCVVSADPERLQQMILNIASTARDSVRQHGQGRLSFSLDEIRFETPEDLPVPEMELGLWARLVIADDGIGMSADSLNRVFEPFFTSKILGRGTGLGLAQVQGIVRQHDGHVEVQAEEGAGTSIKIYFPVI